jgi:hypothetical protein
MRRRDYVPGRISDLRRVEIASRSARFDPLTLVTRTGRYASISQAERRRRVALLLRSGWLYQVIHAEVGWLLFGCVAGRQRERACASHYRAADPGPA